MLLQQHFDKIVENTQNLLSIYISDKDGVIVLKSVAPNSPASLLEPSFTFAFLLSRYLFLMKVGI
jgi:hypothetical protein